MSLKSFTFRRTLASCILGAVVMLLILAGCGSSTVSTGSTISTAPTATTPPAPSATVAPTSAPAAAPTAISGTQGAVVIQSFAFNPQTITVKAGTTITWTDMDSTAHTVTSSSGPTSFDSGALTASGGTFKFTFSKPGTYAYHCKIHPFMTATVIVVS